MFYYRRYLNLIKRPGQDVRNIGEFCWYLLRFQVSESVGYENLICILKCPDSNTDMYSFTIDINLLIWYNSLTLYVLDYNINQITSAKSISSLVISQARNISAFWYNCIERSGLTVIFVCHCYCYS